MRSRLAVAGLATALALGACGVGRETSDGPDAAAPDETTATPRGTPSGPEATPTEPREPAPSPSPDPVASPTPPPAPAAPAGYELAADESGPEAKRVAADLAQALTTYEPGDTLEDVVASATGDAELAAHLRTAAAPLVHEGAWSRGEIVYPQLGGLEPDEAAVITVVRQQVGLPDGTTEEQTRVLDVRIDRTAGGTWRVIGLASAGGEPVPRPDDLSEVAAAVLDDDRIELPDTARWDIHRGAVDERLLAVMARLADRAPYGVVVLETGHSREVFGTDRTSRHAEGRAVDIHRFGDRQVIADRAEGSTTHEVVRWLYDQPELSEVGSPWALDGYGGRSFTDELHQDHVHIGVLRPDEEPRRAP